MRTRFPSAKDSNTKGRICPKCGRKVARSYEGSLCPDCDGEALYREVKEYILKNDVTEMEVAEIFGIPLSQVRKWVDEGYLSYRDNPDIS